MSDPFSEVMNELMPVVDPRQRPAPRARPAPRGSRPRRSSKPRQPKSDPFSEVMKEIMTPTTPTPEAPPQASTAPVTPPAVQPAPGIDFNQPVETVRQQINQLPEDAQPAAIKQWAETYVENERKNGGIVQDFNDVVRNLARGTVVGSWLDEANAVTASIPNQLGFGGPTYDEAVAYNRATDRAVDKDSTKLGKLPYIGDVTAGGLTKLAGGIASVPATPMLNVARGNALLPQMANATATGVGYGGLYGSGEGESIPERGQNAAIGAGLGGLFGIGMPLAAGAAASGVSAARNALSRSATPRVNVGGGYTPAHPGAVRRVERAFHDDLGINPAAYRHTAARLGPEARLADMGTNLQGQAGAIASKPGVGSAIINDAIRSRRSGSMRRIETDLSRALGRPVNIPEVRRNTLDAAANQARPLYDQFRNATIDITPQLARVLQRAESLGAFRSAQRLMQAEGLRPEDLQNNGVLIDLVKRAVDDIAYDQGTGRNLRRIARSISRGIRDETDRILSPNDPTQSIWAQARRAAGTGLQFDEGLRLGDSAFRKSLNPDQMRAQMDDLTPVGRQAYLIGARAALRDDIANAATQFGENSAAKARSMLGSVAAREKVGQLADPMDARRLANTLDAESRFEGTYQRTLQNSQTASRLQAGQEFPNAVSAGGPSVDNRFTDATLMGLGIEGAKRIANALSVGAFDARRLRIAEDAARLLIARGADREQIAQILLQRGQQRDLNQQASRALQDLAQRVMRGATPSAIEASSP